MEPLDRISLTAQAVEAIKRHILTRHLQAGDRLPSERQFCQTLGISRNILREALSSLVAQGVVDKIPGKGAFVGDFVRCSLGVDIRVMITDESEFGALRDLRMMLEIGALELIAERGTPEDLDELESLVHQVEEKLARGERINELDTAFHLRLFRAARSPALFQLYEQVLRDVTDVSVYQNPGFRDLLKTEMGRANISLLHQVIDGLRRGNARDAQQAMKSHISMQHR